jgi:hypothetical protein
MEARDRLQHRHRMGPNPIPTLRRLPSPPLQIQTPHLLSPLPPPLLRPPHIQAPHQAEGPSLSIIVILFHIHQKKEKKKEVSDLICLVFRMAHLWRP